MKAPALILFDEARRGEGFSLLAGVDEAGRGPWAGPVVAAAVALKPGAELPGLDDSKKLSPSHREALYPRIIAASLFYSVAEASPAKIDEINVLQAAFLAMRRALDQWPRRPDLLLVDGPLRLPGWDGAQRPLVRGDGLSACVAAASVLAKVTRDRIMRRAHTEHPQYGFDRHKGYGTALHQETLRRHGPCPLHRRSFAPVRQCLA